MTYSTGLAFEPVLVEHRPDWVITDHIADLLFTTEPSANENRSAELTTKPAAGGHS